MQGLNSYDMKVLLQRGENKILKELPLMVGEKVGKVVKVF